jgi:4-aminobutyrate aminotransferase
MISRKEGLASTMTRHRLIYSQYLDWAFDIARAEGSHLWTQDGRRLIDFTSGWNVTNLGWNHPEVAEAMAHQARKNAYVPMWAADPVQVEYADGLTNLLPRPLDAVGRATGGTEANEMAIKIARAYTGRMKIAGFTQTYHGQSLGTLSIGFPQSDLAHLAPASGDFVQMAYPRARVDGGGAVEALAAFSCQLDQVLSRRDVAAIVAEAGIVTGWGSVAVAPTGFLREIRAVTQTYGTLLILDEVGTGFSRCGKLFGLELESVTPDIVTFAKAMGNGGAAIGALATREDIADAGFTQGLLFSTLGWTPVACAAAIAALRIHTRDRVWEKAAQDGRYVIETLRREFAHHPRIADIRGIGMEIGIELLGDQNPSMQQPSFADAVVQGAMKRNLHLVGDRQNTLQIMPPLTIERAVLDKGLGILIESIRAVIG